MSEPLSVRALNRATLERQWLLRRVARKPLEAVEHLVGMQAQKPLDPYTALWSRLDGFDPDELGEVIEARRAVRLNVMRATIHLVSADDCLRLRPLTQPVLTRMFKGTPFARNLDGVDLNAVVAAGVELLEEGPLPAAELGRRLAKRWRTRDPQSLAAAVAYATPLVQVPPRGVWGKTKQATLTPAESFLGRKLERNPSVEDVIRRYLGAFGPAGVMDVQAWSGLTRLREVTDGMDDLVRMRSEGDAELLDIPGAPLPDPETPAPPRFLPEYDNFGLGYADRERVHNRGDRKPVEPRVGYRTFTVDGFMVGFWRIEREGDLATLTLEPIVKIAKTDREAVVAEGETLVSLFEPDARSKVRFLSPA